MTLHVRNDAIEEHFSIEDYLPVAEEMYRELGEGRAVTMPMGSTHTRARDPPEEGTEPVYHAMRTGGGSIPKFGVAAVRLNSDVKHWPERDGTRVQERIPNRDGLYNGLVFLFSTDTGELLAVCPDGIIQTYHVAGGIAMGAKYLARDDVETLGMIGSGHQARTHLPALDAVLDPERTLVYSPTRANREAFATEMDDRVSSAVRAVDDPRTVCVESGVIDCATNSTEPVFEAEWIRPGTHVGFIRPTEVPDAAFESGVVDVFAVSTAAQRSVGIGGSMGGLVERENVADEWTFYPVPADGLAPKLQAIPDASERVDIGEFVRLPDVVSNDAEGRTGDDDVTLFRQIGDGVAFAALAYAVYEMARERGLGDRVPTEKFMQEHVP